MYIYVYKLLDMYAIVNHNSYQKIFKIVKV